MADTDLIERATKAIDLFDAICDIHDPSVSAHDRRVRAMAKVLEAALVELHGPYGYLIKPIGLNEEHWYLSDDPSDRPNEEISVPLYAKEDQVASLAQGRDATPANPAQVTDAMVEAGHNGLEEWRRLYVSKDEVRAILTAAIGAGGQAVAVKALEWRGTEGVWLKADAGFGGVYRITEYSGMQKPFKLETHGWWSGSPCGHYEFLDEAKAAAQADYKRRILSALVPAHAVPDAVAADWQRIDDALVSCASLIRALASDDIATVAAAELDYVRSALASVKE